MSDDWLRAYEKGQRRSALIRGLAAFVGAAVGVVWVAVVVAMLMQVWR